MMQVSHETIYKSLFIQARGVLKRELIAHLRSRRVMRRGKTSTAKGQPRGQIIDAISIRQRPADIEDRAVPGHREGDLISGSRNSHVATLVERHSRFVMLVHVKGKDSNSVVSALIRQVQYLPEGMMSSLTWDRGTCTSASPWRQMPMFSSAIPKVPGSEAAMKIRTGCCANIYRKAPTCQTTLRTISTGSRSNSIHDCEKLLAFAPLELPLPMPLRQPVEPTVGIFAEMPR